MGKMNRYQIERWLYDFARRNHVRLYRVAIVSTHIHLAIKVRDRKTYNKFIRSLTGTLPKVVMGFQHPRESFWDHRPFTRILEWGKDFTSTCNYIVRNILEAYGVIQYTPRKRSVIRPDQRHARRRRPFTGDDP